MQSVVEFKTGAMDLHSTPNGHRHPIIVTLNVRSARCGLCFPFIALIDGLCCVEINLASFENPKLS